MTLLERVILGNPLADWLIALAITLASAVALLLAQRFLVLRFAAYSHTTETFVDDVLAECLAATRGLFLVVIALYAGVQYLTLPAKAARIIDAAAVIALLVQVALWANRGIAVWLRHYVQTKRETDAAGATTVGVLGFIGRVAVWAIVVLMIIDNLGVNITALVASLGIGGVAVALAVQNILGDIFASLSIALDKPFVIGDSLEIGEHSGVVERIGIKSLRLRSGSGEQIILSNADALKSRIRNFGRATERRAVFTLGVRYETALERLAVIPKLVAEAVAAQPGARLERCHLRQFGDFALIYEVSMYSEGSTADVLYDRQHAVTLAIIDAFRRHGIEFAYPTQRLVTSTA
jgi:small-conductance mechanosensitive channel